MDTIGLLADEEAPRARLAVLMKHFSQVKDEREPWRVMYPLSEILLLLTCATIASCDDFDDIVAWGKHHLEFLRKFAPFHFGIPGERWLRILVNRLDPLTFRRCFESWIEELWPDRHDLIAIDGKTSRRTHDKREELKALHTLVRLRIFAARSDFEHRLMLMQHGSPVAFGTDSISAKRAASRHEVRHAREPHRAVELRLRFDR